MVTVFIIIKIFLKKKLCTTQLTSCTLLVACISFEVVLGWSKWILLVDQETRKRADFWWLIVQNFVWWLLLWLEARAAVPDQSASTGQQEQSQNQRSSSKLRTLLNPLGQSLCRIWKPSFGLNQDIHEPLAHFLSCANSWLAYLFKKN